MLNPAVPASSRILRLSLTISSGVRLPRCRRPRGSRRRAPPDLGARARVAELTGLVGLDERQSRAMPRALSGGQRQRVPTARALPAEPRILILDESVAALDVSIQAQVLNLLADIRDETGVSYVLISHDLAVVRQLTDATIVLRRGQGGEPAPTARVLDDPQHAYTRLLRDCVPRPGWKPTRQLAQATAEQSPADEEAPLARPTC